MTLLAARFLETSGRPDVVLSDAAEAKLCSHRWPGNVRELKGVLEAAANLAEEGCIEPEHLRFEVVPRARARAKARPGPTEVEPLADVERRHILSVYEQLGHNKTQAALALGIGLQTLYRKLKAYGIT